MERTVEQLEALLAKYEENGAAKLYYALNRKMWEMADTLNATDLKTLNLDDPKDKTFDRLKIIWKDSADLSLAVKSLGDLAGVTGNENDDIKKEKAITPEMVAKGEF